MREFLNGVLIPLLKRILNAPNADPQMQNSVGSTIGSLIKYSASHASSPAPENPAGAVTIVGNWIELALTEIENLNAEGDNAICSVTEAHWKTHGLMNWWHKKKPGQIFF